MKTRILLASVALTLIGAACGPPDPVGDAINDAAGNAYDSVVNDGWTDERLDAFARQISDNQGVPITTAECIAREMSQRFSHSELVSQVGERAPVFSEDENAEGEAAILACMG